MQTFKTAVIVVLMFTVLYAGYVAITTPPASVPDEIARIIEIDPAFTDAGDSTYGTLGISDGEPFEDLNTDAGQTPSLGAAFGSLSDTDPAMPAGSASAMPTASGRSSAATPNTVNATPLPKPPVGVPAPQIDAGRSYESTGQANFDLPDPSSLGGMSGDFPNGANTASGASASSPAMGLPGDFNSEDKSSGASIGLSGLQMPDVGGDAAGVGRAPARPAGGVAAGSSSSGNVGLANAILAADQHVEADRMKEALATLSMFYNAPDLTESERGQLVSRLDPLAGEVIYSRLHLLEQPYRVEANETLMEIAAKYEIPWQLLANINGIEDPVVVLPGTELKVVRGPFRAEVDLARNELTLMLGELYAGRFSIAVGQDPSPQPGTYTIQDKQTAKAFYDATGAAITAGDPRNPFGSVWLDLGQQMCIHGSPKESGGPTQGCISLRTADAEDIYGILSAGSTVSIRR